MKKLLLVIITALTMINLSAQDEYNSKEYISEAYSLFKIKSYNKELNLKNCDIVAYFRVAEKFREAQYYIELLPNDQDEAIFRDVLDFNDLARMVVAKGQRQNKNVLEINFGDFYISEYAKMRMVVSYNDGGVSVVPIEMINYDNPITIMN